MCPFITTLLRDATLVQATSGRTIVCVSLLWKAHLGNFPRLAFRPTPPLAETDIRYFQGYYVALAPTAKGTGLCHYRTWRCNSLAASPLPHDCTQFAMREEAAVTAENGSRNRTNVAQNHWQLLAVTVICLMRATTASAHGGGGGDYPPAVGYPYPFSNSEHICHTAQRRVMTRNGWRLCPVRICD